MGGGAPGGQCSLPWPPSWISQELEIRLKPREIVIFVFYMKITHK